jgi:phage-related protein
MGIMKGEARSVQLKPLYWLGSSKRDLSALPDPVTDLFGFALYLAQIGRKHDQAKPLRGFGSAGVLEVVEDWNRSSYRAVHTARFAAGIFVLHVFQKKSKRGTATPKADIDLIRERLKVAEQMAKELSE